MGSLSHWSLLWLGRECQEPDLCQLERAQFLATSASTEIGVVNGREGSYKRFVAL
jgi:hypothetical protein